MAEQIPDKNLFMMCHTLNKDAVRKLPKGFHVRYCRENELDIWKAMHFDTPELAKKYYDFMTEFFATVYLPMKDLFYQNVCLFAIKMISLLEHVLCGSPITQSILCIGLRS